MYTHTQYPIWRSHQNKDLGKREKKKVNKNNKVTVRTNHGLVHKQAGYTKGIKKTSF